MFTMALLSSPGEGSEYECELVDSKKVRKYEAWDSMGSGVGTSQYG